MAALRRWLYRRKWVEIRVSRHHDRQFLNPTVQAFFHEPTFTASYLVIDPASRKAAIIDPVLDFDAKSGRTGRRSRTVSWPPRLEAVRDHLDSRNACPCRPPERRRLSQEKTGGLTGIGGAVSDVQRFFKPVFNATDFEPDGTAIRPPLR